MRATSDCVAIARGVIDDGDVKSSQRIQQFCERVNVVANWHDDVDHVHVRGVAIKGMQESLLHERASESFLAGLDHIAVHPSLRHRSRTAGQTK
jgi:hypothetical protein